MDGLDVHAPRRIAVTGGAGFIGSAFVRFALAAAPDCEVITLDALTYAGGTANLAGLDEAYPGRHRFVQADIRDAGALKEAFLRHNPDTIVHFAAESHVDRSIRGPLDFVATNVLGTAVLLEAARHAWEGRSDVRFHHISTDEVFGDLPAEGAFSEDSPYRPSSPYSASKAGADHLVAAWVRTYGLPASLTFCSNNYGPRQHPEKLVPHTIAQALAGRPVTVYGGGGNVREWIHVEDHVRAVWLAITRGRPGSTYAVGGEERTNIGLVRRICRTLDLLRPRRSGRYEDLIVFVADRPGHDRRYALDDGCIRKELGWKPRIGFAEGMDRTIRWYLENGDWLESVS